MYLAGFGGSILDISGTGQSQVILLELAQDGRQIQVREFLFHAAEICPLPVVNVRDDLELFRFQLRQYRTVERMGELLFDVVVVDPVDGADYHFPLFVFPDIAQLFQLADHGIGIALLHIHYIR